MDDINDVNYSTIYTYANIDDILNNYNKEKEMEIQSRHLVNVHHSEDNTIS